MRTKTFYVDCIAPRLIFMRRSSRGRQTSGLLASFSKTSRPRFGVRSDDVPLYAYLRVHVLYADRGRSRGPILAPFAHGAQCLPEREVDPDRLLPSSSGTLSAIFICLCATGRSCSRVSWAAHTLRGSNTTSAPRFLKQGASPPIPGLWAVPPTSLRHIYPRTNVARSHR